MFRYAYDTEMIDKPIRFGPAMKPPGEKVLRRAREEARRTHGAMMFSPAEIHTLLAKSRPAMKAMILMAANCGFGNTDLATLNRSEVDLDRGWVDHPRPKTGAARRCPLWPETVAAFRKVYQARREPSNSAYADRVFLTVGNGDAFVRMTPSGSQDIIGAVFRKTLIRAGIHRPGKAFYCLRRGFETVAGETGDQVAVDFLMGHLTGDMASIYRQGISDDRLRAVVDHVHQWLFAAEKQG